MIENLSPAKNYLNESINFFTFQNYFKKNFSINWDTPNNIVFLLKSKIAQNAKSPHPSLVHLSIIESIDFANLAVSPYISILSTVLVGKAIHFCPSWNPADLGGIFLRTVSNHKREFQRKWYSFHSSKDLYKKVEGPFPKDSKGSLDRVKNQKWSHL